MRLRPLIVPSVAVSLLTILTGCRLSRTPSPALSIAAVAVSAGGLLVATCSFQWARNAAVLGSVGQRRRLSEHNQSGVWHSARGERCFQFSES
jgi:hypothetical protein